MNLAEFFHNFSMGLIWSQKSVSRLKFLQPDPDFQTVVLTLEPTGQIAWLISVGNKEKLQRKENYPTCRGHKLYFGQNETKRKNFGKYLSV